MRDDHIVCACEASDGIQQDYHVATVLRQTPGLFQHHVGYLNMTIRRLIKRRCDNLSVNVFFHVGDFFRPFVDQQYDECGIGFVLCDRVCELLKEDCLTGFGR